MMPKGFYWLIAAQFLSGLADSALLIVGIAFLSEQGYPPWWAPVLKLTFTFSYVALAPWVGHVADAFIKRDLMILMNAVKFAGAIFLLLGLHPFLCFAVVGFGASVYAPAKYGLVTETVLPKLLVRANGWQEVTVVLSVLMGVGIGGWLVSSLGGGPMECLGSFQRTWLAAVLSCRQPISGCADRRSDPLSVSGTG
jgi:MFS transporter, LPLT family, lysophospholipid transporter